MDLPYLAFLLFAIFSGLRTVSYLPQILKVAADRNGASAISYSTWTLWTCANVTTGLYAGINLHDMYLATVSAIYTACCVVVIALTMVKRRRYRSTMGPVRGQSASTAFWLSPAQRHGLLAASLAAIAVGVGTAWWFSRDAPLTVASSTVARAHAAAVTPAPADAAERPVAIKSLTSPPVAEPPRDPREETRSGSEQRASPTPSRPKKASTSRPERREAKADPVVPKVAKEGWRLRTPYGDLDLDQ